MIDEKKFMEFMTTLEEAGAEHVSFDDLRKFMDEQPKIGEWIPCRERLPEESGEYLTTTRCDGKINIEISEIDCDGKVKKWNYISSTDVIAWQPLPEPYREDK